METQPIARLTFTCNRNWEDMKPVAGGRFCNDCQKKVVDFTNKTNDEIAAYLMGSTTQVCGNFKQLQLVPAPPKPVWKRWLSTAAMFATVFMVAKEASAQEQAPTKEPVSIKATKTTIVMGEVVVPDPYYIAAQFPGGSTALKAYLSKNLKFLKNTKGTVITYFSIEKDGSLSDIKVISSLNKDADDEAIRVLKAMPKWQAASRSGNLLRVTQALPINF